MIMSGSGSGAQDDDRADAAHHARSGEGDQAEEQDPRPTHGHSHAGAHERGQVHATGVAASIYRRLVPHTHDAHDSIDDVLEASAAGIRAVKISLLVLGVTAGLQIILVIISGSVALLADTIHNFADALTAVPLWIAFALSRRPATRRYTYGYGRVEDLAGLFIVIMITLSALLAGYESIRRFFEPQPVANLLWVLIAGVIGFVGNEVVAVYRIQVGRRIGSAALVADGVHARSDGFSSLAVVLGVIGIWLGFPLADPIVGLVICIAIFVLLWGTARDVGRRLLDAVDPSLVAQAEVAVRSVPGITGVDEVRLRWTGHRLNVDATVTSDPTMPVGRFHELEHQADQIIRSKLSGINAVRLNPSAHPLPK
jgi:cation diffusion facilitator family transporter